MAVVYSEWKACWFIKIAAPRKIQPISTVIGEVARISRFAERPADETANNSEFLRCRTVAIREEETWEGIRDAFNVGEKELRKGLDWQASCREPCGLFRERRSTRQSATDAYWEVSVSRRHDLPVRNGNSGNVLPWRIKRGGRSCDRLEAP